MWNQEWLQFSRSYFQQSTSATQCCKILGMFEVAWCWNASLRWRNVQWLIKFVTTMSGISAKPMQRTPCVMLISKQPNVWSGCTLRSVKQGHSRHGIVFHEDATNGRKKGNCMPVLLLLKSKYIVSFASKQETTHGRTKMYQHSATFIPSCTGPN